MTPGERLEGYAAFGIDLFLGSDGRLHVRGAACVRDAARNSIRQYRVELVAYLRQWRGAVDRESAARLQLHAPSSVVDGVCP